MTTYYSTNNKFKYTLTNNTNYTVEQLDYDIILDSFNRWDSLVTVDSRFGTQYQITINITIDPLDIGILGAAWIDSVHQITTNGITGSFGDIVPYVGNIIISSSKMYTLKTTNHNDGKNSLYHVLLHEIGHILGIGILWWDGEEIRTEAPITSYDDNGTTKYYYTGTNALREYKSYFAYYNGSYNDSFVGIPIEDNGGSGTAEGHAEEGVSPVSSNNRYINGIFHPGLGTELMTGWLDEAPASAPLSKITLGFLEDMGYTVNYNLADLYIMTWPSTTDANNLEQTFIQGFLDISGGDIINRHGNLSVLDGTMDVSGDVTFDSKLTVGGDVSFNGTTIDICGNLHAQYPNNSIPSAAIDGLGIFTSPVKFENKVGINTTVIPDANSAALDVSGNINFTGDLYQDGNPFVSGATDLNGLSDVISGGANFSNGLLIGNSTTGSLSNAKYNTGIGNAVFAALTTGDSNTGIGDRSLTALTAGGNNTSIGTQSLFKNATGSYNTSIGAQALFNSTSSKNTGIGSNALFNNTAGSVVTAIGNDAGTRNIENNNNTYLGGLTDLDEDNATWNTSTALGYNAKITASNQIMLGTASETVVAPGQVDICGNLYAKYDEVNPTIPAGAIIGGVGGGTEFPHITINPIDETVDVSGIQALNEYLTFTIPHTMTALKYFCTVHPAMEGDFEIGDYSATETDKTYYVRMTDNATPTTTTPYYFFSDTVNGTALNTATTGSGSILKLYKGNTYKFIKTDVGHPFMVGEGHVDGGFKTTGIKLESTGTGAATSSTYREPYPLHINGTANIEKNLNVAKKLTVSGPIIQW